MPSKKINSEINYKFTKDTNGYSGGSSSYPTTAIQVNVAPTTQYISPLPAPSDLEKYNSMVPDTAERLLRTIENEQKHRHQLENKEMDNNYSYKTRGQHYGLAIGGAGLLTSFVAIILNHSVAGSILGGSALLGIVSVFVTSKIFPKKQTR